MRLPFEPPIEPMLAKAASGLPEGDGWLFEPKWDGFRALVFRDGDETLIQSRDLKPLDRYFPELAGIDDSNGVVDGRKVTFLELDIDGGADDLDDFSESLGGRRGHALLR